MWVRDLNKFFLVLDLPHKTLRFNPLILNCYGNTTNAQLGKLLEGEMRDMLLLSLLTNYAYALPAMRMYHGFPHHVYGPELMTMVLAPAASGKGIMNYAKQLLQGIENEHGEFIFLPANTSAAALMSYLQMLKGRGIMMATEIDTLSKALGSTTGGFSDVLRCMFEHETISKLRMMSHTIRQ